MASEFTPAGPEPAPELVAQIRRGSTRLARRLRMERPMDALSPTKIAVLAHLLRWGAATPGEVAATERMQPQSLTRVIADLEEDGLISRERDERDRRQYVLELTGAGRHVLSEDMGARDAWLAAAMAELSETEQQVLYLAGVLMDRISSVGTSPHQERRATGERGPEGQDAELGEQHDREAE